MPHIPVCGTRVRTNIRMMPPFCPVPSSLEYKAHISRQMNCWSRRCSWSIACRRCSNYIFILNLTHGFNGLGKDNYKTRREAVKFWDLVRLILDTLRYWDSAGRLFCIIGIFSLVRWPLYIEAAPLSLEGVSSYRHLDCLFNGLFNLTTNNLSKLWLTGHLSW